MWVIKQIKEEPVMFQGVIQAGLAMVAGFGVFPFLTQANMGLMLAFSAALLAWATRTAVTPMSNPRNDAGEQLVPKKP
jgi:membrane protein implicated in regulation of membrane protease activity